MLISLEQLARDAVDFRENFAPGAVDLGTELLQTAPLITSGRATLLEEHQGSKKKVIQDIRVVGELSTRVAVACARCLETVSRGIERKFDLLYRPQGIDGSGREEISITDAEAEIGYYTGDAILLEDVMREQVLLAVPIKIVCREECKGLCPHCGKNLNQGSCDCRQEIADPRWDALKGLRDKLQH
jgi:uncharacterized protein